MLGVALLAFVVGCLGYLAVSKLRAALGAGAPGPVDTGFSKDMAVHHDQAILMATLAQGRAGPAVKAIADSILIGQSMQIGAMRGWLQLWGESAEATASMDWMAMGHAHDVICKQDGAVRNSAQRSPMPGMASPEELTDLWGRSGDIFDVLFLQLMIRHHQGGIDMARHAATYATLEAVRDTARVMVLQQVQDIALMQRLLSQHRASMLPFP